MSMAKEVIKCVKAKVIRLSVTLIKPTLQTLSFLAQTPNKKALAIRSPGLSC